MIAALQKSRSQPLRVRVSVPAYRQAGEDAGPLDAIRWGFSPERYRSRLLLIDRRLSPAAA